MVPGCVLGTAVELTTMSGTVDEGPVSIGKRFLLQRDVEQHSATQRVKYTGPERVLLYSSQPSALQSTVPEEVQPRMPTNVPFVNSAVSAMHLNKRKVNDKIKKPRKYISRDLWGRDMINFKNTPVRGSVF